MASMEQLMNALAIMTENMNKLIETNDKKVKSGHNWDAIAKHKNTKPFSGSPSEWEEFAQKFKSQVAAGWSDAAEMLQCVDEDITEASSEKEDWSKGSLHDNSEFEQVSKKTYNLLMSLTTGEAHASVRRCRGNGLGHGRKLAVP